MGHRIAIALLALIPASALGNAGVGYTMFLLPPVVISLVLVVPIEGAVLKGMLGAAVGKAMRLSWRANLASTLWGFLLAVAADLAFVAAGSGIPEGTRAEALVLLGPMFLLSWWIEYASVARNAPEYDRGPIIGATGAANALTYALMGAAIWFVYPGRASSADRVLSAEGIHAATALRIEVMEHWSANKAFPPPRPERNEGRFRIALEPQGRIVLRFPEIQDSAVSGKRVLLVPNVQGADLIWRCGSKEIEHRFLPGSCRDRTE